MTMTPDHALHRLEQFGKLRKEFSEGKPIAGCDTETAGAVESTAPRPSSTLRSGPATEDGHSGRAKLLLCHIFGRRSNAALPWARSLSLIHSCMSDVIQRRKTQLWQIALMSVLAPVLAGEIQTVWVFIHSIPSRYYQAVFFPHRGVVNFVLPIPVFVAVEAVITFAAIVALTKIEPWLCRPAFLFCLALWLFAAFVAIGVVS